MATLATLVALLPTVIILLQTSVSLGPSIPRPTVDADRHQPTIAPSPPPTVAPSPPPTVNLLPVALFTSSLSFFLFSFQVHEKSILLPLMPLTLMMATRGSKDDDEVWDIGVLVNNVAVFR